MAALASQTRTWSNKLQDRCCDLCVPVILLLPCHYATVHSNNIHHQNPSPHLCCNVSWDVLTWRRFGHWPAYSMKHNGVEHDTTHTHTHLRAHMNVTPAVGTQAHSIEVLVSELDVACEPPQQGWCGARIRRCTDLQHCPRALLLPGCFCCLGPGPTAAATCLMSHLMWPPSTAHPISSHPHEQRTCCM